MSLMSLTEIQKFLVLSGELTGRNCESEITRGSVVLSKDVRILWANATVTEGREVSLWTGVRGPWSEGTNWRGSSSTITDSRGASSTAEVPRQHLKDLFLASSWNIGNMHHGSSYISVSQVGTKRAPIHLQMAQQAKVIAVKLMCHARFHGLNWVLPKFVCRSPNAQYFKMCLYLEIKPLKRWLN